MIITSHMQNIIPIYPCLLKLSRKQNTILKICEFSPKTLASNISMLKPIQDNDNYKPHAKQFSNLSMFTQVIAKTRKCDEPGQTDRRPLLLYPSLQSRGDKHVLQLATCVFSHVC